MDKLKRHALILQKNRRHSVLRILEKNEKSRKIRLLKKGKNVRPPLRWWNKMMKTITKEYSHRSKSEKAQILGGIWQNYSIDAKINIIKEYQI